jgi:hypothetical protein
MALLSINVVGNSYILPMHIKAVINTAGTFARRLLLAELMLICTKNTCC